VLEVRTLTDEERIQQLENELEVTILFGEEADRKYEEVCSDAVLFTWPTCTARRFDGGLVYVMQTTSVIGDNLPRILEDDTEADPEGFIEGEEWVIPGRGLRREAAHAAVASILSLARGVFAGMRSACGVRRPLGFVTRF